MVKRTLFIAVVVVLLATLIPPLLIGPVDSQVGEAGFSVRYIAGAAGKYRQKHGAYPETLDELLKSGIITSIPPDPWGNPYQYTLNDGYPEVVSYGADGAPGGTGPAADITASARPDR